MPSRQSAGENRKDKDIMAEMQYIPVKDIYPHPDNPRKDVGDVSELAASIKESGVLQNLTVVPAPEVSAGVYRVVIGHRRLAAAKQAGLETVPCVVSYMTYKQQVATMLAENMQRCDLTPIEQAQGIQMMLDLGEDIKGVSDKTGLSETTVRRRVKLMQLDQDALKAAELRGGTLADYAELETLKDPERRNKVLKAIGTNNFRSVLATEKSAEERVVILDDAEKMLKAMGIEAAQDRPEVSNMAYVRNFGYWNKNQPFEMPKGDDPSNYRYTRGTYQIDLWRVKTAADNNAEAAAKADKAERDAKQRENEAKICECREISERMGRLRRGFILGLPERECVKHLGNIVGTLLPYIVDGIELDTDKLLSALLLDSGRGAEEERLDAAAHDTPARLLLLSIWASIDDDYWYNSYVPDGWRRVAHAKNGELNSLYELLCGMGYEMSDEEKQMQDGTHRVFAAKD